MGNLILPPKLEQQPRLTSVASDVIEWARRVTGLANATADAALAGSLGNVPASGGYFVLTGSNSCTLFPQNGNQLFINGRYYTIPPAGVSIAPAACVGNAVNNIYAYWSGTSIVLEGSTTPRADDATYGHAIKSGDPSRTLVGKAWYNGGGTFDFGVATSSLLYLSWLNKRARSTTTSGPPSNIGITATGGPTELSTSMRTYFASWGIDSTRITASEPTSATPAGVVAFGLAQCFNGSGTLQANGQLAYFTPYANGAYGTLASMGSFVFTETVGAGIGALLYATYSAYLNGAGTATFFTNGGSLTVEVMG